MCPDWDETGDPLVCRLALNPLSRTSQGRICLFLKLYLFFFLPPSNEWPESLILPLVKDTSISSKGSQGLWPAARDGEGAQRGSELPTFILTSSLHKESLEILFPLRCSCELGKQSFFLLPPRDAQIPFLVRVATCCASTTAESKISSLAPENSPRLVFLVGMGNVYKVETGLKKQSLTFEKGITMCPMTGHLKWSRFLENRLSCN